jgi:hypothetical protein
MTRDGVRMEAWRFVSEPGVNLALHVARRSRVKRPRVVELDVLDQEAWKVWDVGMRAAFGGDGEVGRVGGNNEGDAWFAALRDRLKDEPVAVVWLAPRGVGAADWDGTTRQSVHVRRRFMLLGQTLDGMRVWDIRRALEVLHEHRSFRDRAIRLRGEGDMAVNTLMAAAFESNWAELELGGVPTTFRDGPDYLNVLQVLEVPQAVAMAAEHGRVRLRGAAAGDWSYVEAVGKVLGWERERVVVEQ